MQEVALPALIVAVLLGLAVTPRRSGLRAAAATILIAPLLCLATYAQLRYLVAGYCSGFVDPFFVIPERGGFLYLFMLTGLCILLVVRSTRRASARFVSLERFVAARSTAIAVVMASLSVIITAAAMRRRFIAKDLFDRLRELGSCPEPTWLAPDSIPLSTFGASVSAPASWLALSGLGAAVSISLLILSMRSRSGQQAGHQSALCWVIVVAADCAIPLAIASAFRMVI